MGIKENKQTKNRKGTLSWMDRERVMYLGQVVYGVNIVKIHHMVFSMI